MDGWLRPRQTQPYPRHPSQQQRLLTSSYHHVPGAQVSRTWCPRPRSPPQSSPPSLVRSSTPWGGPSTPPRAPGSSDKIFSTTARFPRAPRAPRSSGYSTINHAVPPPPRPPPPPPPPHPRPRPYRSTWTVASSPSSYQTSLGSYSSIRYRRHTTTAYHNSIPQQHTTTAYHGQMARHTTARGQNVSSYHSIIPTLVQV